MTPLEAIATDTANKFQVEPNCVKAIITQESHWNPYVLRFEPDYRYLLNTKQWAATLGISESTEVNTQMTSWGLGQLMGAVARELKFTGHMGQFLDPKVNIQYLSMYVKKLGGKAKTPQELFACYNGGYGALLSYQSYGRFPNQAYVDSAMTHYEFFRGGGQYGKN